jgi:hypothetical protein
VKAHFGSASIRRDGRAVFNIGGNKYRIIVWINYPYGIVYIRFIAIKFRMEQSGLTVKDLEPVIGRKNRVYEILNRRRPLTLRMIEGLFTKFGIPAESLLKQRVQPSAGK